MDYHYICSDYQDSDYEEIKVNTGYCIFSCLDDLVNYKDNYQLTII